jgi:hypothetical protein
MARKTPQEKGFIIPVKRKLGTNPGRYQKAWAKSLEPNKQNKISVCFDDGRRSTWSVDITIHEPLGFDPVASICCECSADLMLNEHYMICSQSQL